MDLALNNLQNQNKNKTQTNKKAIKKMSKLPRKSNAILEFLFLHDISSVLELFYFYRDWNHLLQGKACELVLIHDQLFLTTSENSK